jgi:hypothetical protein
VRAIRRSVARRSRPDAAHPVPEPHAVP